MPRTIAAPAVEPERRMTDDATDDATDGALPKALARALLALRLTLGLFLLQWGVEKFVAPQNTPAIWAYFYGLDVPQALAYVFGVAEIALAVCLFLGLFRTAAYGAAL